jgi:Rrf2 family protein
MSTLLRCSEATALAVHAAIYLAREEGRVMTAGQLARLFRASESHMIKVCQHLARVGYFEARRGPQGGFRFAMDPETVHLLDLYTQFEGPVEPHRCTLRHGSCSDDPEAECLVGPRIQEFEDQIRRYLETTSIASLARKADQEVVS